MTTWTPPNIFALNTATSADQKQFKHLPVVLTDTAPADDWLLYRDADKLTLTRPDGVALAVDFTAGKARHRTQESGFGAQTLAKALGIKAYRRLHSEWPTIIDANAGLGQDAWAVASIGCTLVLIEQHPIVHALLEDGLTRAQNEASTAEIASRITLQLDNAATYLANNRQPAHAIYLDPMYPARARKKAESKKAAQFLQALAGPAIARESVELLQGALSTNAARVVVKRPGNAAQLEGSEQFSGQMTALYSANTRYDIFHLGR